MNRIIILFCLTMFSLLNAKSITWLDSVNLCVKQNLDLKVASESVRQSRLNEIVVGSDLFPQLNSSFSMGKSKSSANNFQDSFSANLNASQIIFDGFKTNINIEKSKYNTLSAFASYRYNSASIRNKLRLAFVNVIKFQEQQKLLESIFSSRKQQFELINLRYEAGREHKGALLTAQANMSQAEEDSLSCQRNLLLSKRKMSLIMGQRITENIEAVESINIVEVSSAPNYSAFLVGNPYLDQYKWDTKVKECGLKATLVNQDPNLKASVSYGLSGDKLLPSNESWSLGLSMSYAFWDWGDYAANREIAQAQYRQALDSESNSTLLAEYNLEEAWNSLMGAYHDVIIQNKYLLATNERAKIADVQYSTGQMAYDNWILIQNDLINIQKSYLNSQIGYMTAEANWILVKGGTLEDEKK